MARFNSVRENFEKREKKVKADLDEASKIWAELSKKFKWWQSLPQRIPEEIKKIKMEVIKND